MPSAPGAERDAAPAADAAPPAGRGAALARLLLLVLLVGGAVALAWRAGLFELSDRAALAAAIERARALPGIAFLFVLAYALVASFGMPATPLTLAGGAIFGTALGSLLNWTGATLGAGGAYLLARLLGSGALTRLLGRHGHRLSALGERTGTLAIFRLRLIPVMPFNGLNFAAGLAGVRPVPYLVGTALGIVPGTVVYTYFASSLVAGVAGASRDALMNVVLAAVLLLALSFLPALLRRMGIGRAAPDASDAARLVLAGVALAGAALVAAPAGAQAPGATVRGLVREQAGRPLAGATVAFTRADAGPDAGPDAGGAPAVTDSLGRFTLAVPATTRGALVVRRPGYASARVDVPALAPGAVRTVAATLAPLARLDVVSVVAERLPPLLNTVDAATGGTIERAELEQLPTDARQPLALAFTIPGVSQATGFFGDAPPLTINGANALYSQYSLDGLENNEGFLGGPRVELPLAALSRLTVLANGYSTAFGRSSNGVIDLQTRSGGEEWTGEAFVYNRPGLPVDARAPVVPRGQNPDDFRQAQDGFRRTQVGGAGGGPLVPGRTYAFGALEYTTENEDRIASTANATFTGREVRDTWKLFGRLDHGWSPTQTTTLRVAASSVNRAGEGSGIVAPEADITTERIGTATALVHRTAFRGGRASNTASAQVGTFRWNLPPTRSDFDTPQVTIARAVNGDTSAVGVVGSSNFVFDERELQLQLRNVFETAVGERHAVRVGVDAWRSSFELAASQTNPSGSYVVLDEGNIPRDGLRYRFADIPQDVRVLRYTVDAAQKQVDLNQTLVGAFVEDRWRLTPALTLTLGLRWDYDDLTSRGASDPDLDNWQPRASVNWLVTPTMVVRGSAGRYAGKFPYAVYSDAIQFGPDGNQTVTFEGSDVPAFGQGPRTATLDRATLPPGEIRELFALGLEQPMSTQLTAGWQAQLGPRLGVSLDGVWMDTRNLPRSWDLNANTRGIGPADTVSLPVSVGDAFRPVTPVTGGFRRLTTTESGGRAAYAALYTALRYRAADALLLDGNWTWSRSRNDTEDINFNATVGNDFDAEWADAVNDRRHHVSVRATWTGVRRLTLAGIADWQTGTPVNRVAGALDPVTGLPSFRDLDGSGDTFGNGFLGNQDRFFGVGRNAERLPSAFLVHASVAYRLAVPGVARDGLELRADVFNLFNSTNPGGYANGIPGGGSRTQVGRPGDPIVISNAGPPRQVQFSARYVF